MENLSVVFQKQKKKKTHEEIEFHNSIQDCVFTIYLLLVGEKCLEKYLILAKREGSSKPKDDLSLVSNCLLV